MVDTMCNLRSINLFYSFLPPKKCGMRDLGYIPRMEMFLIYELDLHQHLQMKAPEDVVMLAEMLE
ncbi:hypothetical protein CK203_087092 [Vitis vinifera]|uniref:Uncharacterized protein n=1 Tax=Vitis vinifera TaxID=29760 RepID=A0A438EAL7_VITVI|nr:hypothetical protein CK203_087092 [Vitis vinifera]